MEKRLHFVGSCYICISSCTVQKKLNPVYGDKELFFCALELRTLCVVTARMCGRGYGVETRNC
jgi:hypothetical protein